VVGEAPEESEGGVVLLVLPSFVEIFFSFLETEVVRDTGEEEGDVEDLEATFSIFCDDFPDVVVLLPEETVVFDDEEDAAVIFFS